MSRHEDSFQIPLPPEQAKSLCAEAIASLGLPVTADLGHGFACAESFQFGFTWPATVQAPAVRGAEVAPVVSDNSEVEINKARPVGSVTPPGLATLGTMTVQIVSLAPHIDVQIGACCNRDRGAVTCI